MLYLSRHRSKKPFRVNKKLLAVIIAVLVIVVLTILLGLYLKSKAEYSKENSSPVPEDVTVDDSDIPVIEAAPVVAAFPLDLENISESKIDRVSDEIYSQGFTGVALKLTDNAGIPLYSSEIVSLFNSSDSSSPSKSRSLDLGKVTDSLHRHGLKAVGCFEAVHYSADSAVEDAQRSYEIALISEMNNLGIDELVVFGLPAGEEKRYLSLEYLEKVRTGAPGLEIGIAAGMNEISSDNYDSQILISRSDFLVLVLDLPDDGTPVSEFLENLIKENPVIFTKYSPRLMLPFIDDQKTTEEILAFNDNNILNWMIY